MTFCIKKNPELLRNLLKYDAETGFLYWSERPRSMFKDDRTHRAWNTNFSGKLAIHGIGNHGYRKGRIYGVEVLAHRVIWAMHNKGWPDGEIDHIDGDQTNNRIDNLRCVTSTENSKNAKISRRNTSGRTGVSFNKAQQKWVAYIASNKEFKFLGTFSEKKDAITARKKAEEELAFHPNHGRA